MGLFRYVAPQVGSDPLGLGSYDFPTTVTGAPPPAPVTPESQEILNAVQRWRREDPTADAAYRRLDQLLARLFAIPNYNDDDSSDQAIFGRRSRTALTGEAKDAGALIQHLSAAAKTTGLLRLPPSAANAPLPLTTDLPDRRPGAAPGATVPTTVGFVQADGTFKTLPAAALQYQLGRTPDRQAASESAAYVADRNFDRSREANASRESVARLEADVKRAQQEWDKAKTALEMVKDLRGLRVKAGEISEDAANHDIETYWRQLNSVDERLKAAVTAAGTADTNLVRIYERQSTSADDSYQRTADYAREFMKGQMTQDTEVFKGNVVQRGQDLDLAKSIALEATKAFTESLKHHTYVREDMVNQFQQGLVALAAGRRASAAYYRATDFPVAQAAQAVGEAAVRSVLGRGPDEPLLPPQVTLHQQNYRELPAPPAQPTPPTLMQTPEMISALATPDPAARPGGMPTIADLRAAGAAGSPEYMAIAGQMQSLGLLPPGVLDRPGMAPPLGLPPAPAPAPAAPELDFMGEDTTDFSTPSPISTPQVPEPMPWNDSQQQDDTGGYLGGPTISYQAPPAQGQDDWWNEQDDTITNMMDLIGFRNPDDLAGVGVSLDAVSQGYQPEQAFGWGFPNDDWQLPDNWPFDDAA